MESIGTLDIQVADSEIVDFHIDAPDSEGYIIGRSDSDREYLPDIDLAPYGARDQGVSRRHAVLVRFKGQVHIVDLQSVNGTFLNDERLLPEVPYPIQSGDRLRLANLDLAIQQIVI